MSVHCHARKETIPNAGPEGKTTTQFETKTALKPCGAAHTFIAFIDQFLHSTPIHIRTGGVIWLTVHSPFLDVDCGSKLVTTF